MKKKILLIEDTEDLGEMVCDILRLAGYEVKWAKNGQEGWQWFQTYTPDVVITDLVMPVMGGLEVIELIRKEKKDSQTPIIILSAKATPEDEAVGIKAGASLYLRKPCSSKDLLDAIKKLLN
jgi:DNA-binding response OmpR family regulator